MMKDNRNSTAQHLLASMQFFFCSLLLFFLAACTGQSPIINNVDERDANEIVVLLSSKGIPAQKEAASSGNAGGGGSTQVLWNIVVSPDQAVDAMSILNRYGLPRKQGQNLLDLFSDSGLVPTEMQQKIRYQAGLAQQIANAIRQIDGVVDADVQLSFPPDGSTDPITASVYVKHNGVLDNPNSQLLTKIKQLVAGSVTGLKLENVTVVADRARYADVTLNQGNPSQDSNNAEAFVTVWSMNIAKDSVGRFQAIFFTLILFLFLMVCLLAWILWKFYPLLHKEGWSKLWSIKPIESSTADVSEEIHDDLEPKA